MTSAISRETTKFNLIEATIAEINHAFDTGALTSEQLVQLYLNRIEAYDQQGPALNALISLNPQALKLARSLDEERRTRGARSPLHGIPVVVKDVFNTVEMPTTGGTLALKDVIAPEDATVIKKLKASGAIILGKNNLEELHINAALNNSFSSLAGAGRNPYDPTRIPGGSSGGTASAIAANFATVGVGTDTGGSNRTPPALQSLVGIKPTLGLVSRAGMLPLTQTRDVVGPIARTVTDAAILLNVLVGYDAADPATANCLDKMPEGDYTAFLQRDRLKGARIGIFCDRMETATPDVAQLFATEIATMQLHGAEMIPVEMPDIAHFVVPRKGQTIDLDFFNFYFSELYYNSLEYDLNQYLPTLGIAAPIRSAQELRQAIAQYPAVSPTVHVFFNLLRGNIPPEQDPAFHQFEHNRKQAQAVIAETMKTLGLEALIYTTSGNPAPQHGGEDYIAHTDFASFAGLPAITVPGGFVNGLPIGIEFLGTPFSEPELLSLAYSYEQATQNRIAPATTPPLPGEAFELPG